MSTKVRRLEVADRPAWERLFRDYVAFYRAAVPDDVIALTFERTVAPGPDFIGLVALDDDGTMLGFAMALLHPSTWSASGYCYLEDLYVAPEARGKGAGRALIEAVYAAADQAGATRTYWVTETANTTARRLYDSLATVSPFVQYRR